jgi:chromosome segregation ATPase
MDEAERITLEREVQEHLKEVEDLGQLLQQLEQQIEGLDDPPKEITRQISAIRGEIRGRMAAIAMGEARLGVDPF